MALYKAKQLDINGITQAILNNFSFVYNYSLQFQNLVNSVNTFTTGTVYPTLVKNILVTNITSTIATISWTPVPSATSYNIQINPKGDKLNIITVLGVTTTNYTVGSLTPNTSYEVAVQAIV